MKKATMTACALLLGITISLAQEGGGRSPAGEKSGREGGGGGNRGGSDGKGKEGRDPAPHPSTPGKNMETHHNGTNSRMADYDRFSKMQKDKDAKAKGRK